MCFPKKLSVANLPTRIEKLERLSERLGKNIYIKRDDMTGMEFSGNKIRKLEYSVSEAIEQGCDTLITCGGVQSNHARATAALAARLGLKASLVLRKTEHDRDECDGNLLLDNLFGADVRYITDEEYTYKRYDIMEGVKEELASAGRRAYIIPEGASNGIGNFGYINAVKEIMEYEKQSDVHFDAITVAVGSGGTYSGLYIGDALFRKQYNVYGINICADKEYFEKRITRIIKESTGYHKDIENIDMDRIKIIDGYAGRGYALNTLDDIEFIREIAALEGIVLDPVYTGKAMKGLVKEIDKGSFDGCENILFIHTGGMYGVFPKKDLFL